MFGDRIKSLREQRGKTQKQLADIIGVTPAAIGLYEQNRRTPDAETLKKLANYFDVSIDYLLCYTDIKNSYKEKIKKLIDENATIAAHRIDGYDDELPEEAKQQLMDYIEFLKQKYKKKK